MAVYVSSVPAVAGPGGGVEVDMLGGLGVIYGEIIDCLISIIGWKER